jgi:serine/threonine protein kinase
MTPVADCNLAEFYHSVPTSQDKLSLQRSFFGCLATTLTYLHDSQVRHKDIKPQNILVYKSKVLLTDFGISRDLSDLSRSTTTGDTARTRRYCAPKVDTKTARNTSPGTPRLMYGLLGVSSWR